MKDTMKTATEILFEHGINLGELNDDFNTQLLHAMERYAEQKLPIHSVSGKRLSCQKECGNTQPASNGLICLNCGSSLKAVCVCGALDKNA